MVVNGTHRMLNGVYKFCLRGWGRGSALTIYYNPVRFKEAYLSRAEEADFAAGENKF